MPLAFPRGTDTGFAVALTVLSLIGVRDLAGPRADPNLRNKLI